MHQKAGQSQLIVTWYQT